MIKNEEMMDSEKVDSVDSIVSVPEVSIPVSENSTVDYSKNYIKHVLLTLSSCFAGKLNSIIF